MTHLILHKVRGLPAFDIATQLQVGDETWWIIPTSGHRAYPVATWPLTDIAYRPNDYTLQFPIDLQVPMPADIPDHYASNVWQGGGSDQPRSVPAARKSTATLTIDDLE